MNKKLLIVVALAALVSGGAFAQLTFGVTGALHMDQQLSASEIASDFKSGDNIYYGGFIEIIGKHIGLGFSMNYSPATVVGAPIDLNNWDDNLYLSYHFFGGRAFLDPFFEFGLGAFYLDYVNASDRPKDAQTGELIGTSPISASPYWFGAFGLGLNFGPIGLFGKFAFNGVIQSHWFGNDIPYYGTYSQDANGDWVVTPYVPQYRVSFGVKLIL